MKRLLLLPLCVAIWVSALPTHYRTISFQKSAVGHRYALAPAMAKVVSIDVGVSFINIGSNHYKINDGGTLTFSDSVYGYQCTDASGVKCAISIGRTEGETAKYRIIVMWPDSMYLYKAN